MQSLLFCKVLAKKPGWKDSNFQVMNAKFDIVATLASKAAVFGKRSTACILPALVEKLGDIKVRVRSNKILLRVVRIAKNSQSNCVLAFVYKPCLNDTKVHVGRLSFDQA